LAVKTGMSQKRYFLFDLIRSVIRWFLVGVVTFILFFPILAGFLVLFLFDRDRKQIHPLISIWAKAVLVVCPLMHVRLEGTHHLKPNATYVLVANHQSISDIIAVLHLSHPFKFIAKRDLFWIPFFGWGLWLAGYIPLIRGNQKSGKEVIQKATGYLKRGVSALFFPEGTRSRDGEIQTFKVGAFKLSSELNIPVVPIVIHGTRDLIPKGSRLLQRRVEVTVKIEAPQQPFGKDNGSIDQFCEKVRSDMIDSLCELRSRAKPVETVSV